MNITAGNLDDPRVQALLEHHVARARAETGRGSAHALDLDALRAPARALYRSQGFRGVRPVRRLPA